MRYIFLLSIFALFFQGCASSPAGSTWAYADFNKYKKNYAPFKTAEVKIGQSEEDLFGILGTDYKVIEAGEAYEVISYQKWKSVAGPDYVEQTLYIRLVNGHVKKWKITSDTIEIVPRSW